MERLKECFDYFFQIFYSHSLKFNNSIFSCKSMMQILPKHHESKSKYQVPYFNHIYSIKSTSQEECYRLYIHYKNYDNLKPNNLKKLLINKLINNNKV